MDWQDSHHGCRHSRAMECEVTNDAFKLRMVLQEVEKLEGYIPTIGVDFANKLVNVEGTAVNVQV